MTTVKAAISSVRGVIQDQMTPYRYSDADLVAYLNEGIATMFRIRPDFMVGAGWGVPAPYVLPTDAETPLPPVIADFYFAPLVEWISGRAFLRDTQYGEGGVSLAFHEKMRAALLTTGV